MAGTLKHILCLCKFAHQPPEGWQGPWHNRIKWRHYSVLEVIETAVLAQMEHEEVAKAERARVEASATHANPLFRGGAIESKSETGKRFSAPRSHRKEVVFGEGDDWKVQFDYENEDEMCIAFPPEIAIVSGEGSRPNGVMGSMETKTVVWIELTSPWEDNCDKARAEDNQIQ